MSKLTLPCGPAHVDKAKQEKKGPRGCSQPRTHCDYTHRRHRGHVFVLVSRRRPNSSDYALLGQPPIRRRPDYFFRILHVWLSLPVQLRVTNVCVPLCIPAGNV